jgi:hypothetical protein
MKKINEDIGDDYYDIAFKKEQEKLELEKLRKNRGDKPKSVSEPENEPKNDSEPKKTEPPKDNKSEKPNSKPEEKKLPEEKIEIPKEISDLQSGVKFDVMVYKPLYNANLKGALKLVSKDRIKSEGEMKNFPDVGLSKDTSKGKWVKASLTKESMIKIHKKLQKEQISIGQDPLYKVIMVPKKEIGLGKTDIEKPTKGIHTKENPLYGQSAGSLTPTKVVKTSSPSSEKKPTPVTPKDANIGSSFTDIDKIDTSYNFYAIDTNKKVGAGFNDLEKAKSFAQKQFGADGKFLRKIDFIKYKNANTEIPDIEKNPKYDINDKPAYEPPEGKGNPVERPSKQDYESDVTYGKYKRRFIKREGLLESIIRKKIKKLLQENEIGKYIGVEGPDVKKKD